MCHLALFQIVVVKLKDECSGKVSKVPQQLLHDSCSNYYVNTHPPLSRTTASFITGGIVQR